MRLFIWEIDVKMFFFFLFFFFFFLAGVLLAGVKALRKHAVSCSPPCSVFSLRGSRKWTIVDSEFRLPNRFRLAPQLAPEHRTRVSSVCHSSPFEFRIRLSFKERISLRYDAFFSPEKTFSLRFSFHYSDFKPLIIFFA